MITLIYEKDKLHKQNKTKNIFLHKAPSAHYILFWFILENLEKKMNEGE